MTPRALEGDDAGCGADGPGLQHGDGTDEGRRVRDGDGRRRGVPQADAPAGGQPSEHGTTAVLLDQEQLARWLGVTERFIRRLVSERRITYVKLGKQVRFDPADVVALIERSKMSVTPAGHDGRPRRARGNR